MSQIFGYWSDLARVRFDDSGSTATWIMAAPLGTYQHPVYGEVEISPGLVQQFAQGVKDKIRGQDLDVDYDHKVNGGEAAGWVKDAEARSDGLWLLVDWTKSAYQKLKDKAYRYFSPEFQDEWKHPETGVTHKNVLFGGALTNRPFLKSILPINMSELFISTGAPTAPPAPAPQPTPSKGGHMDPKKLREALGLKEDASDADVVAKLAEGLNPAAPTPAPTSTPPAPAPSSLPTPTEPTSPADVAALLKQLSDVDGNPAIKALTDLVTAQQRQLAEIAQARRTERVDRQLADLDQGKSFAVPPVVKEQLRDILLRSPDELGQQVLNAYKETLKLGVIDLTERGWQRRGDDKSPTQLYLTAVDELMTKSNSGSGKKMTYAEAASRVAAENPQLAAQYREESYIPSEGR